MIEDCLSRESGRRRSFIDLVELLKQHHFGIVGGVDSAEVSAFSEWVESGERFGPFESCAASRIAPPALAPAPAPPRPRTRPTPGLPSLRSPPGPRTPQAIGRGGGPPDLTRAPLPRLRR
jgi:hypothetical protein